MFDEIKKKLKPCPLCGKEPLVSLDTESKTAFIKCECGHGFTYYAPNTYTQVTEAVFPELIESWNVAAMV